MTRRAEQAKWRSEHLSNILVTVIDYRGLSVPKSEIGVPLITARNVREGTIDFAVREYIEESAYDAWARRGLPVSGDVLFTTEAPLGNVALFPSSGRFAIGQRVVALRPLPDLIDAGYLLQFLLSPVGKKRIDLFATGSTAKGISSGQLHKLLVDFPPIAQQQKIASVLFQWDAAIEKTEQLIAAKESSQRGWMQKLVMDRLFPEHRLSEFVHRVNRKNTSGNGHPLTISGRDGLISQSHYFDKRIAAETTEHYTQLKRGEFSYNKSYSAGYPYGAIKRLDAYDEGIVSTLYLCFALNPDAPLLSDYLIQFCEVGGFNHQIHKVAQEGARNHGLLNVAADDFFAMKLPVPPIEEQSRVVAILGDAGRELALLRKSLYLLRQQKRGLMQKLLTGQWRVKLPEKETA